MDPRAAKLSLWAKENAVWSPFTKYFCAPAETVSAPPTRSADGQSDVEGSQQCKHVTLRVGTAMARTNMVTDSVLKLCAVLEQAAACLSDVIMCTHDMHLAGTTARCQVTLIADGQLTSARRTHMHARARPLPTSHPQHAITTG